MSQEISGDAKVAVVLDVENRSLPARRVLRWAGLAEAHRRRPRLSLAQRRVLLITTGPKVELGRVPSWITVAQLLDVVTPDALSHAERRAHELSSAIALADPPLIEPHRGVNLVQLNRHVLFQEFLRLERLRAVFDVLEASRAISACTFISADRSFTTYLPQLCPAPTTAVAHRTPPVLARLRRILRGWTSSRGSISRIDRQADAMAARLLKAIPPHPAALFVAESLPILEMLQAVMAELGGEPGDKAMLRTGYAADDPTCQPRPDGPPCLQTERPLRKWERGAFRKQWREVRQLLARRTDLAPEAKVGAVPILSALCEEDLPRQVYFVSVLDRLVSELRPGLLVVGNDRCWSGQAITSLARRYAARSLCIQDGLAADNPTWWWCSADHVAASSGLWARLLRAHGVAEERITVTGQPRFDRAALLGQAVRAGRHERADPSSPGLRAVLALQPEQTHAYQVSVAKTLLAVPDLQLVVRPHPSEPAEVAERLLAELPTPRVQLDPGGDLLALIASADVVVTQHSSVAVEAVLAGVPVLLANFTGLPSPLPLARFGLASEATSADQLAAAIRSLADKWRLASHTPGLPFDADADVLGPLDGQSTVRVADLVGRLMTGMGGPAGDTERARDP